MLRCEHRREKKKSKNLVPFYTKVQFVEGTWKSNFSKKEKFWTTFEFLSSSFFISVSAVIDAYLPVWMCPDAFRVVVILVEPSPNQAFF